MSAGFARLHPAVQHHVVNSLGWTSLRPLQERAIGPVLDGCHALLAAPTAGGKTEAALLPLLSRMVEERWGGLSVLYLCPLRALLNNLQPRIAGYADLVGRRAEAWHGDVGPAQRRAIQREPPDLLLTTPESVEAMLISRSVDAAALLRRVRAVVVDELHAFARDDRGWHMLAVLARLDRLTGRETQRIGMTATVGNPEWLLDWLVCGGTGRREVVTAEEQVGGRLDLEVDWVASLPNAARVVATLHRGEKRLVFADSRARVEELAAQLREHGVSVFVSHSSLSRDERRAAEGAFAEGQDCVIVATSTLELGIDVGDLDRVVQIGAPSTVASLLQRVGRTGRRPGGTRSCLFLATTRMELLHALALVALVRAGWVEPLAPAARPVVLLAQQLLARVLSEGRVERGDWPGPLAPVIVQAGLDLEVAQDVRATMVEQAILVEEAGLLSIGPEGERRYGRRHFMEVTSLFLTEPLLAVRWGRRDIGSIDPSSLSSRDAARPTVLLGGRAWGVREVDWARRVVWVEPVDEPGRSRWSGSGAALSMQVCQAIRAVLDGSVDVEGQLSRRAAAALGQAREEHPWAARSRTTLVRQRERGVGRWWTFAGGRANTAIAAGLESAGVSCGGVDDLGVGVHELVDVGRLRAASPRSAADRVDRRAIDAVKFSACLPEQEVRQMLAARQSDVAGARLVMAEPVSVVEHVPAVPPAS